MFLAQFTSVTQLCPTLQPHGLQHARLPCPSPMLRTCSNSCPSSRWCHPTISSSVVIFSSCFQSFPASGSFPMSQFFASGGQSIGVSASTSVFPMNMFLLHFYFVVNIFQQFLITVCYRNNSSFDVFSTRAHLFTGILFFEGIFFLGTRKIYSAD